MQAAHVKPVTKSELNNQAYIPTPNQKIDKTDSKESNVVELQKQPSFNRFLEAYGDCV